MGENEQFIIEITEKNQVIIDILLICANKPTNYANLKSFTYDDLWKVARSFAAARNHALQDIDAAILAIQEAITYEKLPEMIAFAGVRVQQEVFDSASYYAREKHFQDTVFESCEQRIWQSVYDTLGFPIEKARQRECQIARTYLQYLNDILFHGQGTAGITIDPDNFKHHYDSIYGKEMQPTINRSLVTEVLQLARLGYEYDGRFYPFWYTVRNDIGPKFRQKLSECIAARIS